MLKEPNNPKLLAVCWVVCCACIASTGCQRRAYTDLYAESMASEIRELEDRIYEYDAAYQGIEEELAILQSENHRLHDSIAAMQTETSRSSSSSRSLFKNLPGSNKSSKATDSYPSRESMPVDPEASFQVIPKPDPVPAGPPKSSIDSKTPSVDKLPSPVNNKPAKTPKVGSKTDPNDLVPPTVDLGSPSKSILPPSGDPKTSGNTLPSPKIDSLQPPPINNSLTPPPFNNPASPPPNTGTQHRVRDDHSVQVASHQSSDLKLHEMPEHSTAIQALPASIDDDAIDAGKIELPSSIQPAAFQRSTTTLASSGTKDTKVIEIAFHPTLCRGQYLGSNDPNDGMHLVLQPRNASGEPVDLPASLTIVVLDPHRPESQSKLGRWTMTKEEVDAQLEPIGIGHGYHLPLKWQEAKPAGDAVQVYVRYEMEDGRRLVNERRLQLHVPTTGSASWTPRVAK